MKSYLVTLLSNREIQELYNFYDGWKDIGSSEKNLEAFSTFNKSWVDSICIFWKIIWAENYETWGIVGANIYTTQEGIFYFDPIKETFEKFEVWSHIYILRIQGLDIEYLSFLKNYWKIKWNIHFYFSYELESNYIHTKQFWLYYGEISWNNFHIPQSIVPLIWESTDLDLLYTFIKTYPSVWNKIIIKSIWWSWWEWVYIFDFNQPESRTNFNGLLHLLSWNWNKKIICMNLIDTKDYELRVLWAKNKWEIKIIQIFKKVRKKWEILHNISQWNNLELALEQDIPTWCVKSIIQYCLSLPDKHWWLDVLIWEDGNFFFTENNTLTWYLDTAVETPYLDEWIEAVSRCYE